MHVSGLLRCALHPVQGFRERAATAPTLGQSFGWMLLLRGSLATLSGLLTLHAFYRGYPGFKHMTSPVWGEVQRLMGEQISLEDIREGLAALPDLPAWSHLWPWMLLLGPLGIASAWLHNAVWDHACLWILGGVKRTGRWRITFIAEAEAMQVGAIHAAFGFLSFVPVAGPLLAPILALLGAYFWVMRGLALAAFHGAPMWKGAVATVLHVVLAGLCFCGMLGVSWLIVVQSVAN